MAEQQTTTPTADIESEIQNRKDNIYRSYNYVGTKETIASVLPQTDLVINCVKWPKQRKDFLIDKEMLKLMEKGSVNG